MTGYLDTKNDLTFKRVFGDHPRLCMSLLNNMLPLEGEQKIVSLEYLPAELVPDHPNKRKFYPNTETVAYTIDGEALTGERYRTRVNAGIEQCMNGESISLEDLSKELGYDYGDL
ncbi:MAG: Rpn family recombination-promoting nuclease/putative transposase [Prevotellaceae bacterium]|jgi:hypothetical protein|nr:Rpn family recombination-promoting nuclease/putative transposase [Prevotellaceae bacterium]